MATRWVAVLGGTSTIGRAIAAEYAQRGYALLLCGRHGDELGRVGSDIALRHGCEVRTVVLDAFAADFPGPLTAQAQEIAPLHGAVWAFGTMEGAFGSDEADIVQRALWVNFGAAALFADAILPFLSPQGFLGFLSSVAGDRGRGRDALYGGAKAGLTTFALGLRHRLGGDGPRIAVVKVGPVDSQMTWGLPGAGRGASPLIAARAAARAIERGRPAAYVPWHWAPVMLALRLMPEPLYRRIRV